MTAELRIGYVPYSPDLSHPDDRRRFPFFAQRHQIKYELADENKSYDIVLLPASCNLTKWMIYKKRHPNTIFIFEMVDSLTYQNDWKSLLFKGTGRFLMGKEDRPSLVHKDLLVRWIRKADVVICSNPKVKSELQQWNKHIILNLDYLEHEYPLAKTDYGISGKMKLFWEGQGVVLPQLLGYKRLFKEINAFCELHIVTAATYPRFAYFLNRSSQSLLKELPIDAYFHPWDLKSNAGLFGGFDCGIIPLNEKDQYGWHKPANKLLSFWFSGIPTLASNTPAYNAVAAMTDNDFICSSIDQWVEKIKWMYHLSSSQRKDLAMAKLDFARSNFSNEINDAFWMDLLDRVSRMCKLNNKVSIAA